MKVKRNFLVEEETVQKLGLLQKKTFRKPGQIIDWLVTEACDRLVVNEKSVSLPQSSTEPEKSGIVAE